jgi:succinate dehydrogenase / fumarate reductase cytochrome b subunit
VTNSRAVRNRGVGNALRYRGGGGMWAWMLHRATGLGVLLFLIIHVVETAAVIYSPEFYDSALVLYKNPVFRFAELLIFFSVLFHAANGLRIVVQDFWPVVMLHQRQLTAAAAIVAGLVMVPVTWIMVAPLFGLADEPGTERHIERCATMPDAPACQLAEGAE